MKTLNQNLDLFQINDLSLHKYASQNRPTFWKIAKKDVTMWTLWVTKLHSCIMG